MKTKILVLLVFVLTISSCVPKSDYEKLERQLSETEQELSDLKFKYDQILEEKRQEEIEKARTPYVTESQALGYIKDYYSFYNKDTRYRNVELRRTADNRFKVSLETCTKKGSFSNDNFFWNASVRTLTVYNDGKYDFGY